MNTDKSSTASTRAHDRPGRVIPVILDVDTGVDDALALIAAVRHPDLDLLAVSCVTGNASLERVVENTLRVLDAAGAPAESRSPPGRCVRCSRRRDPPDTCTARTAWPASCCPRAPASRPGRRGRDAAPGDPRASAEGDDRRARPADEPRAAAAHPSRGRREHRAHRLHGRVGRDRQRDRGRRVQRLARPGGRRRRHRLGGAVLHVRARRVHEGGDRRGPRERARRARRCRGRARRAAAVAPHLVQRRRGGALLGTDRRRRSGVRAHRPGRAAPSSTCRCGSS